MLTGACKSAANTVERSNRALAFLPAVLAAAPCRPDHFAGGVEPTLAELIADPIFARLLDSDNVRMADLLTLIARTQAALTQR